MEHALYTSASGLPAIAKVAERLRGRLQSDYTPVQIRTLA